MCLQNMIGQTLEHLCILPYECLDFANEGGVGTQYIEESLTHLLLDVKVLRVRRDQQNREVQMEADIQPQTMSFSG